MADMSMIPGTPSFIQARKGKSTATVNTQAADAAKAVQEVKNDSQYSGGGEVGKA